MGKKKGGGRFLPGLNVGGSTPDKQMNSSVLQGLRLVNTRAVHQAASLTRALEEHGAEVLDFPVITLERILPNDELEMAIEQLESFDWVLLTSTNAVHFFAESFAEIWTTEWPDWVPIAAVGAKTAQAIEALGWPVSLVPEEYMAEGLLKALPPMRWKHVLLPQARGARPVLAKALREAGAEVEHIALYETMLHNPGPAQWEALKMGADVVLLTSPSTAHNFAALQKERTPEWSPQTCRVACLGPVTTAAAEDIGYSVCCSAEHHTLEGLVNALCDTFSADSASHS